MTDHIGEQIGEYQLIRFLGKGGFGKVYLGESIDNKMLVAVKVLGIQLTSKVELTEFINEARTIRLSHPHIVQLLDFGVATDGTPFLVMAYAPNGTLKKRHPKGSQLPLSTVVSYVNQIADALQYAHNKKLIHRDVKPDNLLVGANNEILVSDFGIAVIAHSSHSMIMQDVAGTAAYMAPEQLQGQPTKASDQYALGVIVYQWLTGFLPFEGNSQEIAIKHLTVSPPPLRAKVPTIPLSVEQVVLKVLAKDPGERFGNIQEFATKLAQACGQSESSDKQLPPRKPPVHSSKGFSSKRLGSYFLVLLAFALVVSGIALLPQAKGIISNLFEKTPIPSPTVTRTPSNGTKVVTITPNILLTAEANPPDYHDVLNSSSTQKALWQSIGTNNSRCIFEPDGYHVQITTTPEAICHEKGKSYQDSTITIDMVLNGRGSGGLLFRDQNIIGGNGAYFFEVNSSGQYNLSILSSTNRSLRGWISTSAIHRGSNVRNTLQVIASGHLLTLYINGMFLTSLTDGAFLFGGISLACFNSGEAIFSNLNIYLPH